RAPPVHLARPDRRARRGTPARHQQFAWSPVWIAFAAETTKSWPGLFSRAVRPTERSARRLGRPQPVYVYVGDLGHRVATWAAGAGVRVLTVRWSMRPSTYDRMMRGSNQRRYFENSGITISGTGVQGRSRSGRRAKRSSIRWSRESPKWEADGLR